MSYEELMEAARRTNAELDEMDRKAGFPTPVTGIPIPITLAMLEMLLKSPGDAFIVAATPAGALLPLQCRGGIHIRTVMSAIEAGIRTADWTCIAEAQAMLEVIAS